MVCANYFPLMTPQNRDDAFRNSINGLDESEFALFSRITKQNLKSNKSEFDEKKQNTLIFKKIEGKLEEIITSKCCFELNYNEEFYSNQKNFPYKSIYNKDDDMYITEIRKYGIEKFDQYFQEEEYKEIPKHEKIQIFKQLPLDYLIDLLNIDREELKNENKLKIQDIKKVFFNEELDKLLLERAPLEMDNILKDLEYFTNTENDFLNYLEAKQQLNLAIMNMDLYDNDQLPSINSKTTNLKSTDDPENVNNEIYNESGKTNNKCNGSINNATKGNGNNDKSQNQKLKSKIRRIIKDDIVCQVCNDGDYSEDNMIVFCSVFI